MLPETRHLNQITVVHRCDNKFDSTFNLQRSQIDPLMNIYILSLVHFRRVTPVTGQLANKPTRGQSSCGLINSQTSQLAEMFDLRFGVYNSSKCYFRQITLFIRCQYSIVLELGLWLGLMCKQSIVIPWYLKIRCQRVDYSASYPVHDLTGRELVCRLVVL